MLAGVQLGVVGPGPALKEGAIDDQLHGGIQILHSRHTDFQSPGDQGCVGGDDSGGGGLRDAVDLGEKPLGQVVPQVRQCQAHTGTAPAPEPRTPAGRDSRRKWSRTGPQPRCERSSCYYPSWRFVLG